MKFNAAISFLVFTSCFCISMTTALRCSCAESIETVSTVAKRTVPDNPAKLKNKDNPRKRRKDVMQLLKETNKTAENQYLSTKKTAVRADDSCVNLTIIGRQVEPEKTNTTFKQLLNLTIYSLRLFGKSDGLISKLTGLLCNYELLTKEGGDCPVNNFMSASRHDLEALDDSQKNDYKFIVLCDIKNLTTVVHKHLEKPKKKKGPTTTPVPRKTTKDVKINNNTKGKRNKKKGNKSKGKKTKESNTTRL